MKDEVTKKCDFNLEHTLNPPTFSQGYQWSCSELSKGEGYVARNCYIQPTVSENQVPANSYESETGGRSFPRGALKWQQPLLIPWLQLREMPWARHIQFNHSWSPSYGNCGMVNVYCFKGLYLVVIFYTEIKSNTIFVTQKTDELTNSKLEIDLFKVKYAFGRPYCLSPEQQEFVDYPKWEINLVMWIFSFIE